jgi:hypothetical protein
MQVRVRDQYAFPYWATPGIDPTHIAFSNGGQLRFFGFATPSGMLSYANGRVTRGVPGSAVTFSVDGMMGPILTGGTGGATTTTTFANQGAVADTVHTMAAIYKPLTFTAAFTPSYIYTTSTSNAGVGFEINIGSSTATPQPLGFNPNVASDGNVISSSSPVVVSLNIPYFIIVSYGGAATTNSVIFLLKNLLTGVTRTQTIASTATALGTNNATHSVGSSQTSRGLNGSIAAVAHISTFLSIPELLYWAQDPWSFWYPTYGDDVFSTIVGKAATSLNPFQSNLFFM